MDSELNDWLRGQSLNPGMVEIFNYKGDIFETINDINKCGYSIAMRLHGVVASYFLRVPFLSIEYHRKNSDFIDAINYPVSLSISEGQSVAENVLPAVDTLLSGPSPFLTACPPEVVARNVQTLLRKAISV